MEPNNARDPLNILERVATQAREESVPQVDVIGTVLTHLREEERTSRVETYFTFGALAAALAMLLVGSFVIPQAVDPLEPLFQMSYSLGL
jgi:flagellar biogenesis protein FliO